MKKILGIIAGTLLLAGCAANNTEAPTSNGAIDNIMSRKSVRSYVADKPISEEDMTTMLKAAMAAPSGMNVQPWSFVVLTDKSNYDSLFAGNFNLDMFKESAALVVVCADTTVTRASRENPDEIRTEPNKIWRDDMGACTENLLLAAESLGIGAVWTACYPYTDRYLPVKEGLGLPAEVVPYCIVSMGYPAGDDQPKDKWKEEKIHYNRW